MNRGAFKDNSILLIPYVIKNRDLVSTNCLYESSFDKIGAYFMMTLKYKNFSNTGLYKLISKLKSECAIYTVNNRFLNDVHIVEAVFLIPESLSFTCSMLLLNDESVIGKNIILDNVKYWKEYAYLVFV